jgi:signal transduction histidine kinase
MRYRRLSGILWLYITSLVLSVGLLALWVVYVLFANEQISRLVSSHMTDGDALHQHWIILGAGCLLFVVLIVGISLQLAQGISEHLYSRKQREFVANVTHELKSPLAAITLHCQTLLTGDVNPADTQKFLTSILTQTKRMTELVNNVLEVARLNDAKAPLVLETIPIQAFLNNHAQELATRLNGRAVDYTLDLTPDTKILANPIALTRVLDNLIDNAVKACPNGETIGCHAQLTLNQLQVEIEVWDKGQGIAKKEQKKIFKRFYQIGAEIKGRRKGTGLGLAIVKGLMREMKAHIRVVSGEGQGTRFILSFARSA